VNFEPEEEVPHLGSGAAHRSDTCITGTSANWLGLYGAAAKNISGGDIAMQFCPNMYKNILNTL